MDNRKRKIVKYRKRRRIRLSSVIFLFVFIYLAIILISYFSSKHLSIYEVVEEKIADDDTCQGIILRTEKIYKNTTAGYISFYVNDGDKLAKTSTVYALDESGKAYELLSDAEADAEMSDDEKSKIRNYIRLYQRNFSYNTFSNIEDLKSNIDKTILDYTNNLISTDLKEYSGDDINFTLVKAKKPGIFSSGIDGFEDLTKDSVTLDTFQKKVTKTTISPDTLTAEGTAVYKLITSEEWNIILDLSKEQYKKLYEIQEKADDNKTSATVKIKLLENDMEVTVPFEVYKSGDGYFAYLTMDKYMNSFLNDRFLDVQMVFNSAQGLKIPKSSVIKKKFYVVPVDYLTAGGDDNSAGLVKQMTDEKGNVSYQFAEANIVSKTDQYAYLDDDDFQSGDTIQNAETQETYQIGKMESLSGVYNVNKGYCVFRQIEVLYENDEYMIVSEGTYNGLSNYDHILLDASTATDDEIIK